MTLSLVHDLMIILSAGLTAALICRRLNVSILIGYLLVGAIIGRGVSGWVQDEGHQLAHFAEVGVFFLLFSIGIEFSIDDLKRLGTSFVIGGATQMLLVAGPVAAVLTWRGFTWQSAVLMASAFAFSSTVLVFRALTEFGHAQRSHGRRAIGILLFQDAALVPLLLMIPLLTGGEDTAGPVAFVSLAAISLAFIISIIGIRYLLAEWIIPMFANYRSSELVVLFTIVSLGGVTLAAYAVGLPAAAGAFAAGLIFNGNRWSHQIDALVLPFRETFAAVFFVGLGLIFDPRLLLSEPQLILVIVPVIILLKAVTAAIALKLTGLPTRQAFGMGIGLAHVGEFAFVLVLLGVDSGVLSETDYHRVVAIAIGTLVLTPTLIKFGLRLQHSDREEERGSNGPLQQNDRCQAIVIGAGPIGRSIGSQLETLGNDVCMVDLSPINLHSFAQQGFRTVAGDATDEAILVSAGVTEAALVVVCIPDDGAATRIVKAVRHLNADCRVLVRCRYQDSVKKLRKTGASDIVTEESEAAIALLRLLKEESRNR
ncbi:cation:proton antiporter domain-containing protein [Stieleria varia]|uniref:Inner membrane protein YbaL n=1 Tax=Stieleria varia TaxID=2528005 RepID=A0A5C6B9L3_9BACT|nr:cation:proton antiporter [Stieleria varia]TWU08009.1 Inner membrane protein YbaL [Stieleria varia]